MGLCGNSRQFQRTQQVIGGYGDLDDRQRQVLLEHFGGAAPGDDHIIIAMEVAAGDFQPLLQISHKQCQIHLWVLLCQSGHQGFHPLKGSNPQDPVVAVHNCLQNCLKFKHIIPNSQKQNNPFSTCFKDKRFG